MHGLCLTLEAMATSDGAFSCNATESAAAGIAGCAEPELPLSLSAEGAGIANTGLILTEADIPGASLNEPFMSYTMPELRWWLLCRGISVPASLKKKHLVER